MEDIIPEWNSLKPGDRLNNIISIAGIITNLLTSGILNPPLRLILNRRQEAKDALKNIRLIHIALLATTITAFVYRKELNASLQTAWLFYILLLATSIIIYFKNRATPNPSDSSVNNNGNEPQIRFRRFEQIVDENRKIRCTHINYPPLLDNSISSPTGIGIKLLEHIFGENKINTTKKGILWNDIKGSLWKKKLGEDPIDIIATPLFQTRDRLEEVLFCSPIFFSEVGIYIAKDGPLHNQLKLKSTAIKSGHKIGFDEAIDLLKEAASKCHVTIIEGEISHKMINRHLNSTIPKDNIHPASSSSLLPVMRLVNSLVTDQKESEIVFMDVLQAELAEDVKNGSVINILDSKQLLYPVSFAVRKDDLVLRNYINLKLLELSKNDFHGILGLIADAIFQNNNKEDIFNNKFIERLELDFIEENKKLEEKHNNKWKENLDNNYKEKWAQEWAEKRKDKAEQVKAIEKYFVTSHAKPSRLNGLKDNTL